MQDVVRLMKARSQRGWSTPRRRRAAITFYLFISPWLVGFLVLWFVPLVAGLGLSFTDYNGMNWSSLAFVGLNQYVRVFREHGLQTAIGNTFRYMLVTVPVWNALALMLALMLNQRIKARVFLRTLYYLPALLPAIGAVKAWALMFNQNSGVINAFLSLIRPGTAINWLLEHFWLVLYLFSFWGAGGGMVVYLAALQGIPTELGEAARIDGARAIQVFRFITLPLLTPVIFFQIVLGVIFSLQILSEPILLLGKMGSATYVGIPGQFYTYMVYVYSQAFDYQRYGYGVALSWVLFLAILLLTIVILRTSKYWVYYEVRQER